MDGYFNFNTLWFFQVDSFTLPIKIKYNVYYQNFKDIPIFKDFYYESRLMKKKFFKTTVTIRN